MGSVLVHTILKKSTYRRPAEQVPQMQRGPRRELNQHLRTVIVAPMATGGHEYPWRIACRFQNRSGFVALDQLRTVDREGLVKRLGRLSIGATTEVLETLQEMFAE
jgi:mRNA-degrading endonuclease toxin of MazEF toxin-antitoxin module